MSSGGSGFAYDAVRKIVQATEARRANAEYWHEIRENHWKHHRTSRPSLGHGSVEEDIAQQLDQGIFLTSPRLCPECGKSFALIHVKGVEIDTCLDCGSFWLDAGEFGALTAHEEILQNSLPCEPSTYPCPVCGERMGQRLMPVTRMKIEVCPKNHGFYLERGELPGLVRGM